MNRREIETILKQVEQLLATAGMLPAEAEEAVEKLRHEELVELFITRYCPETAIGHAA